MSNALWLVLLALVAVGFGLAFRRANELFALGMKSGKLVVLRGRVPPALFGDLAEIVAREPLRGELRVLSESGLPRLTLHGASQPALEQAARNVLGRYQVAQIRAGRLRAG